MRSPYVYMIFISLACTVMSCTSGACYDDIDPLLNTGLYASGTGAVKKSSSIKVLGETDASPDTLLLSSSVSSFSLPLNPAANSITLYITLNDTTDTAIIDYINMPHLVSPGCGYTFLSEITGLVTTHNIIDTLIIENKSVTLDGEKNLRLFY